MPHRPIAPLLLIPAACFLAISPFFLWGSPSGHDFEFHMFSWMDVLSQWKQGIPYPHWAAMAHWGYGEARFLFYPAASWMLGAALGALFPWKAVPGAYCCLVLALAGFSMMALARQWLPSQDAVFAAIFYALNPYHLLIVYWRSAYAELLAAVLLPLLLLCMWRITDPGWRPVLWLSLVLAASWLTNDPAAIMIHYSAALLAIVLCVQRKSLLPALRVLLGVALSAGLVAFYLLPAMYEQRWVNIGEVLSAGVTPRDNFLFTTLADLDHNRFNLLVSLLAVAEGAVLGLSIVLARREPAPRRSWSLLSLWGAATLLVMFPVSSFLWTYLPAFRFVQLPFRWLLCLNAALAILLALATTAHTRGRWLARAAACGALLAALLVAARHTQMPWWDAAPDIALMSRAVSTGAGYEGTDEYVPVGADPYEIDQKLPRVSIDGSLVPLEMKAWRADDKRFVVQTASPTSITVRLFNYPSWQVLLNGKVVETQTTEITGLMRIPVPPGTNKVWIRQRRTSDQVAGDWTSAAFLVVFVIAWVKAGRVKAGRPELQEAT